MFGPTSWPINSKVPISNLQFIPKITERAVFDQVYSHITDNDLFPVLQSAYRKGHSKETALLGVVNDILSNMNKRHVSILVLLDLSVAFDTVDHTIWLGRFETSFGITDAALACFASYLSGRSQRLSVSGERLDGYPLPVGVPQGLCLRAPTLQCLCQQAFRGHQIVPAQCPGIR